MWNKEFCVCFVDVRKQFPSIELRRNTGRLAEYDKEEEEDEKEEDEDEKEEDED